MPSAPSPQAAKSASVPTPPADFSPPSVWLWALLVVGCLLVYLPALNGGMLWDDPGHVTRPDLRTLEGLGRIWFERGATQQYYPMLHSAFWLEHRIWGDAVLGYHLINVLLHATAAFLFGAALRRLAIPGAWLAALLFAFHPVAVESVAWISEQKNTLSAVFYLASALAYLRFDAERRGSQYAVASGLFVLALLTKTVTASLPAALLVVFWWKRGRLELRRDVLPLLPWFAAGAVSGLFTAQFERELIGANGADFALGLADRVVLAGRVVWFYFAKLLWPADLMFMYPRWTVDATDAVQWLFPLAAVAVLAGLVWLARRHRAPLAAALFFGGSLFPVLGFFNVYPFIYSYVADHFQYLPSLGIFAAAGAGLTLAAARLSFRTARVVMAVLVATLAALSWRQSRIYTDVVTLYEATLARNPQSWMAHNNLAIAFAEAGRVEDAIPHLETALRLKPDFAQAANNLGDDLLRLNRPTEAIPYLERAVSIQPRYAIAHHNLGLALATVGRTNEAIGHFERAVQIDPQYAEAELDWGIGLMLTDRFDEAVRHFERAIALNPDAARFRLTYGRALVRAERFETAVVQLRRAVELDAQSAEAHWNLAIALRRLRRFDEAAEHHREAVRLDPSLAQGR